VLEYQLEIILKIRAEVSNKINQVHEEAVNNVEPFRNADAQLARALEALNSASKTPYFIRVF
jgi:ABC-type transporter Mla subunit MlaD